MRQNVTDFLLLVNDRHPLTDWPGPDALAPVAHGVLLRRPAAKALRRALCAVGAGDQIVPVSGFRPHEEQTALYESSLRENGRAFTEQFVALPGCSEHETGLAIDLGEARAAIDPIRPAFPDTGVCGAFRRSAARFGFIERYPAGARGITHIGAEPWHFRYIGLPHAVWLTRMGVTLEEYIEQLLRFTPDAPLRRDGCTVFCVPENAPPAAPCAARRAVSATNCGALVVTEWGAP